MERPFDSRLRQTYETLEKSKENFIFNFNQNDKILVWIVGFCVTAISLIISNVGKITVNYSAYLLKTILILLGLSITSGIIYRFSALLFLTRYQNAMFYLKGAFSQEHIMAENTRYLKNCNNIHEIYQYIKMDFGHDYSYVIKLYKQSQTEESKNYYTGYLMSEYERLAKWSKKEYEHVNNYIKIVFKNAFGFTDKKINKIFNENSNSIYLKLWTIICKISISICLISFISAILIIVFNYK